MKVGICGKGAKSTKEILAEMQKLETKEEMIIYLRSLPKLDEPWPETPKFEEI